jgi:hypothetical protein
MDRYRLAIGLLITLTATLAVAAPVPPADVLLAVEAEGFGAALGLTPTVWEGASGGRAMALGDEGTGMYAALKLVPGKYTLLLVTFAPAGDQDGLFVEIAGQRTRRTVPIGRWGTVAWPFTVAKEGLVSLSIIGQESGLLVDRVAVVKGTYGDDEVKVAEFPAVAKAPALAPTVLPRVVMGCKLRELPPSPPVEEAGVVLRETCEQIPAGVVGEHSLAPGKTGQGLRLGVPDGRLDIDLSRLGVAGQGTVELWLRPRPGQRLWHSQGWHYFLQLRPAGDEGFQLDLSRHPRTGLRLSVSPPGPPQGPGERLTDSFSLSTDALDLEAWHHLLVSWDLSGQQPQLWLLVDGQGRSLRFDTPVPVAPLASLHLGNSPPGTEMPYLPVDGVLDEIVVRNTSVAGRLVGATAPQEGQ